LQSPGVPVLSVAKTTGNWVVKVAVTEKEVNQLTMDLAVQITLKNTGDVLGHVSKIPAKADPVSNLFNIEISLSDDVIRLGTIAGQLAEVSIVLHADKSVYHVPIKALISVNDQGQALLAVVNNYNNNIEARAFDIKQLKQTLVFLDASESSLPINLVVDGWQHLHLDVD
jgi:hypothetical protein